MPLRFELLRDRNILVVIPEGPLEQADFEQFAQQVDRLIASAGRIAGLMIEARMVTDFSSRQVAAVKFTTVKKRGTLAQQRCPQEWRWRRQ